MLVLTRRANQSIIIGNDIIVTVLEIRGDQVRLGITAPRSVSVHREEVYAEIQRENREAALCVGRASDAATPDDDDDDQTPASRRRDEAR
jgi:carbon storage regulator